MKKRFLLLLILLFVSFSAFSIEWDVSGGLYLRNSAQFGIKPEVALMSNIEDFTINAMVSDYSAGLDLEYNYKGEDTFRCTVGTSLNGYYRDKGLLWTLYSDCGQDFRFWDRMALRYRGGIQFGLSWSGYAPLSVPVSLSPYIYWAIGYDDDVYKALVYGHSMRSNEHTFQTIPVLGIELGWNINDRHAVGVDTFMKLSDYMDGPDLMISDIAFRVFYTYKGVTE